MLTKKEAAEKRRLDRKIFGGRATRKEALRALELRRAMRQAIRPVYRDIKQPSGEY